MPPGQRGNHHPMSIVNKVMMVNYLRNRREKNMRALFKSIGRVVSVIFDNWSSIILTHICTQYTRTRTREREIRFNSLRTRFLPTYFSFWFFVFARFVRICFQLFCWLFYLLKSWMRDKKGSMKFAI